MYTFSDHLYSMQSTATEVLIGNPFTISPYTCTYIRSLNIHSHFHTAKQYSSHTIIKSCHNAIINFMIGQPINHARYTTFSFIHHPSPTNIIPLLGHTTIVICYYHLLLWSACLIWYCDACVWFWLQHAQQASCAQTGQ